MEKRNLSLCFSPFNGPRLHPPFLISLSDGKQQYSGCRSAQDFGMWTLTPIQGVVFRLATFLTGLCNMSPGAVCLSVCVRREDKAERFGRKQGRLCLPSDREVFPKLPLNSPGNVLYILQPGIPSSRGERERESHCVPSLSLHPFLHWLHRRGKTNLQSQEVDERFLLQVHLWS